jgi:adenosylhomocysteinase
MAQAFAQGFRTAGHVGALAGAGLVICATGNRALAADDFPAVPNGAYIASVTSTAGHYFYVLNSGNAVNFLHGACVGPFIYLV